MEETRISKKILYVGLTVLILLLGGMSLQAQDKYTISGIVKDSANGEFIIGAGIYIKEIAKGAVTNSYGFYSITIPGGHYTVDFTYIGYQTKRQVLDLKADIKWNVELGETSSQLQEVIVSANGDRPQLLHNLELGTNTLDIKTIQKLPALLGEVDIIKSLQFLPGVSQVGEGSSGFNVRGGTTGQNLVLLDEAPIYNSSHLLGFFSVFNPDAVKDVKLFKGAMPANYGGRISSVLDVRMKEGNMKKFEVNGGVGLVFSRLSLEGPIVKDKSSFIIAARRSYIDILAKPILKDGSLNFYDVTLKTNFKINEKNHLYVSGYLGRDNFSISNDAGFSWGNESATVRWNTLITKNLFANVSGVYSNYSYTLDSKQDDQNSYKWNSAISNYLIRPNFTYFINENSELNFGGEMTYYQFNPATTVAVNDGEQIDNSLDKKYAVETAAYVSHSLKLGSNLEIEYGLRLSNFRYLGGGVAYTYNDTIPGRKRSVVSEEHFTSGQTIASYTNPEPRFTAKFELNEKSTIKANYNRNVQYVQFISNTTASNPLNVWTPSTNNLKPTIGDQISLGYFRTLGNAKKFEMSAEAFYRSTQNEVDYINGADLLSNKYLEGDLLSGSGRSYGLELFLQKKTGKFTGLASYTLSKSELQVDGINQGKWYPTRYDQTHNFKIVGTLELSKRWSATADFVYTTGTPTTFPDQRYTSQGILIPYNSENARNSTRIGSYNRLDLSFRLDGKTHNKNGKERKNRDYWVFSAYNVYGRKNPYSIYFTQSSDRPVLGQPLQSEAHQVSVIGSIVPSISYNFKF